MTFFEPRWLFGLVAIPLLLLIEWHAARRADRGLKALVGASGARVLLAQRLPGSRRLSVALRLGALLALVLGASGPEWGREVVRRPATGSDVLFVIDVSASMDARDVPPSRLDEARREALALLERLGGSRVGVLAFAGDAVRLCPFTLDLGAARLTLESLSSGSVSEPGSDLGRALRKAAEMMPGSRRDEQVIVLWTDGEDTEAKAEEGVDALAGAGVRVFAVGVGTPAGDVVPVLDDQGRAIDVKRDDAGAPVLSRLDESALRDLGRRTRGAYFSASRPGGELPRLTASVAGVGRSARGERLIERPVARFTWCAAVAALLIAIDLRRPRRRRAEVEGIALRSERLAGAAALIACLGGVLVLAPPAAAQSDWARADRAYRAGRFVEAESLYVKRLKRKAPPEVRVNRATALAELGRVEEAETALAPLTDAEGRAGRAARYNLGTTRGRRGDFEGGLAALRDALIRDPRDADARWNYEMLLRMQREAQQRPPQPGGGQEPEKGGEDQKGPEQQPDQGGGEQGPQNLPQAPQQQPSTPQSAPVQGQAMSREQAERILGALDQVARLDQQRQRRVRVVSERRGKDW